MKQSVQVGRRTYHNTTSSWALDRVGGRDSRCDIHHCMFHTGECEGDRRPCHRQDSPCRRCRVERRQPQPRQLVTAMTDTAVLR
jgi:hypothetical protein